MAYILGSLRGGEGISTQCRGWFVFLRSSEPWPPSPSQHSASLRATWSASPADTLPGTTDSPLELELDSLALRELPYSAGRGVVRKWANGSVVCGADLIRELN